MFQHCHIQFLLLILQQIYPFFHEFLRQFLAMEFLQLIFGFFFGLSNLFLQDVQHFQIYLQSLEFQRVLALQHIFQYIRQDSQNLLLLHFVQQHNFQLILFRHEQFSFLFHHHRQWLLSLLDKLSILQLFLLLQRLAQFHQNLLLSVLYA